MEEKYQDFYNVEYIHTVLDHPYNKYIGGLFTVCRILSVKAVVSAIGAIPSWTQRILHTKIHSFSSWVVQLALWQAGHPHGLRERGGELEGHKEVEVEEDRKLSERKQEKERDLSWRVNEAQQSFRADSSSHNELAPSPLATPPPPPPLSCWLSVPQITTDSWLLLSLPPQVPILSSNSTRIRKV